MKNYQKAIGAGLMAAMGLVSPVQGENGLANVVATYNSLSTMNAGKDPKPEAKGNWWYLNTVLKSDKPATVTKRQKCYVSSEPYSWCDPVKTDISDKFGTERITNSEGIKWEGNWVKLFGGFGYIVTETFWFNTPNGEQKTSYTFRVNSQ